MVINGTNAGETLTGTPDTDYIYGFGGNDHLIGLGGNDSLDGGTGVDTMEGGAGSDAYRVDNPNDVVIEKPGEGIADLVDATSNWTATAGSEIEFLRSATSSPIALTGNLHSDAYAMSIYGGAAGDTLSDGGGRAVLYGETGNDTYVVTNAKTQVVEYDGTESYGGHDPATADNPMPFPDPLVEGYDTVRTNLAGYTLPDNVEVLTYFGSGNFTGTGNSESNLVTGGAGNDTLDGAGGVDRLVGGAGNDTYKVDDPRDTVVEQAGGGYDTILSTASGFVAPANVEALTYVGTGNFTGFANATGVSLTGGSGNDYLHGGAGNDVLDGDPKGQYDPYLGAVTQGETETLTGGAGADTFILHPSGYDVSRITDFTPGTDHLKIVDSFVLPYIDFETQAPQPYDDEGGHNIVAIYYYDQPHGALYFIDFIGSEIDGHEIATFDNHPTLSASDFVLG